VAFGVLWSGLYAFLGLLHGMPQMFKAEFPFLLAPLLGIRSGSMSANSGAVLAFLDAAILVFVMGTVFVMPFNKWFEGKED